MGKFVTFEGVEGGGKTTQLRLAAEAALRSGEAEREAQSAPARGTPVLVRKRQGSIIVHPHIGNRSNSGKEG